MKTQGVASASGRFHSKQEIADVIETVIRIYERPDMNPLRRPEVDSVNEALLTIAEHFGITAEEMRSSEQLI